MECCLNFLWIFLNIEQNILFLFFFSIFHVFFTFHAISNIIFFFKLVQKKIIPGGGGVLNFFFRKTILSYFTFYAIFNIKKNRTPVRPSVHPSVRPSRLVYWLNGRWFLQIPVVDRDSWNLYPLYPLFPCSDCVSQMWGWFGGGGVNVFLTFYAIVVKTYPSIDPIAAPPDIISI